MSNFLDYVELEYEDFDISKPHHSSIKEKGGKIYASIKRGAPSKKQQEAQKRNQRNQHRRNKARKARRRKEISNILWRVASLFVRR